MPEEVAAAHVDGPGDVGGQALANAGNGLMHCAFQDKKSRATGAVLLVVRAHPFPPRVAAALWILHTEID